MPVVIDAGHYDRARAEVEDATRRITDRGTLSKLKRMFGGTVLPDREARPRLDFWVMFLVALFGGALFNAFLFGPGHPVGITMGVAIAGAWVWYRKKSYIRLDVKGIEEFTPRSRHILPWSEIESITAYAIDQFVKGRYRETEVTITLGLTGGRSHVIKGADGRPSGGPHLELLDAIKTFIRPRLMRRDLARFEEAGVLTFGPLRVSKKGLHFQAGWLFPEDKHLPWDQVAKITVANSELTLYAKGRYFSTFTAGIANLPNYFSLLAILERQGYVFEDW